MILTAAYRFALFIFVALATACGGGGSSSPSQTASAVRANTQVNDDIITISSAAGRAIILREPLGIRFEDSQGNTVLETVSSPSRRMALRPANLQRVPLGLDVPDLPPLYAPFTFLVGTAVNLSFPATFWVGNMLASASLGMEYRLERVLSVEPSANGVVMRVSTSDPTGREAEVSVTADTTGSFKTRIRLDRIAADVPLITAAFASPAQEAFRGFGGRRNRLDQRGQDFINWTEEFHQTPGSLANFPPNLLIEENFQFPTGPQGAYYIQSLFISSANYGFLLERDELSHWRMASDRHDAWMVEVAGGEMDFVVAPGPAPEAIKQLTEITGRHRLPPAWALGPMLSEAVQSSENMSFAFPQYDAKIQESLAMMRDLQLPVSAFIFEGWAGLQQLGSYQQVVNDLNAMGIRPMTYYRAFLGQQDDALERPEAFDEALAQGYMVKNSLGLPYLFGSPLVTTGLAGLIDFTNPEAVRWWKDRIKQGLAEGSQGFMQDFGEQTFPDMVFHDGSTGITMHNRYAVLFHRATREAIEEYAAEHPSEAVDPFFFVRSGYTGGVTGRLGSAAYEGASWPGDNTADWSRASGIGSVIPDMLNRSVGGAYGFVSEIGGYLDTLGRPSKELLIRWSHHASLMPVYRLHGGPVNGTHMPWRYDSETVAQWRRGAERHIAAQGLIMRLWREALATGMPITRPLWLAFPNDPIAAQQDQQFMLGPDILVAPVVEEGARARDVYFPAGCWQHPEDGSQFTGPMTQSIAAPLHYLPYYFRCGTQPFEVPASVITPQ